MSQPSKKPTAGKPKDVTATLEKKSSVATPPAAVSKDSQMDLTTPQMASAAGKAATADVGTKTGGSQAHPPLVPKVSITQGIEGLAEETATADEVKSKPRPPQAPPTAEMKKRLMKLDTLNLQGGMKRKSAGGFSSASVSVPTSPGLYPAGSTGGQAGSPTGGQAGSPTSSGSRQGRLLTRQSSGERMGRAGSLSPNRSKKRSGSCRRYQTTSREQGELEASIERSPQSEYKIRDFFGDKPIADKCARRSLTIHPGNLGPPLSGETDTKTASTPSLIAAGTVSPTQSNQKDKRSGAAIKPSTPSKSQKVKGFFRMKSPKSPGVKVPAPAPIAKKEEIEPQRKLSRQGAVEEEDGRGGAAGGGGGGGGARGAAKGGERGVATEEGGGAEQQQQQQRVIRRSLSRQRQVDEQDGEATPGQATTKKTSGANAKGRK